MPSDIGVGQDMRAGGLAATVGTTGTVSAFRRRSMILFDAPHHCAVLDVAKLAEDDIAFGSNSYRGDVLEDALRSYLNFPNE